MRKQGYLRCAKALILDEKLEKALEVYAYGLKTLSDENPECMVGTSLSLPFQVVQMILRGVTGNQTNA